MLSQEAKADALASWFESTTRYEVLARGEQSAKPSFEQRELGEYRFVSPLLFAGWYLT